MKSPSLPRHPLLLLAAMVVAMCAGGCRHARSASTPLQKQPEPSFAVVRAKLQEPVDEFMAYYVVSRVLWSDSALKNGDRFLVFCRDGSHISSQAQPLGGVREWPSDAVLALVEPDSPIAPDIRDLRPVTTRWEHWIVPASEQTVRAFAKLSRERLIEAHERERTLERRKQWRTGQPDEGIGLVVDADADVADHAVLSIVVLHGHRRSGPSYPNLVVAIWPSGRIVWGKDLLRGGAPYREGHVSPKALLTFRERLTAAGIMDGSAFGKGGSYVVSGGSTRVWIFWDDARVETGSSRDLYLHADEGEPPEFAEAWKTLKSEVEKLIPDESTLLPEYDFQIL